MKKLLLLCGIFATTSLLAQEKDRSHDKLDARLKLWVNNPAMVFQSPLSSKNETILGGQKVTDPTVSIIFKTSSSNAKALVEKHGGALRSAIGPICTAELPVSRVVAFAGEPEVIRIESSKEVKLYNEKGKQLIGADKVEAGALPEGRPYTGKGVLVGVVDTGIDFLHPDFRHKDDPATSRIYSIWDQTALAGIIPQGFTYGAEWTREEIQSDITNGSEVVTERDSSGHGTHVTGTSAGLRGVAYDAEIISVKTPLVGNGDYKFTTSAKTLEAVNYIYQKAIELDRPCVVNMSLGFNFGAPHDGTSLFEQGIDYMVSNRKGFIVCASAGNEGSDYSHHGGYELTADSVWTYVNSLNGATWYNVSDSKYDDSIYVSVIMDSAMASFTGQGILNQKKIFQTPWLKLSDIKNTPEYFYPVLYGNGDTAGTIRLVAANYDENRTELYIYPRDRFVASTATSPARVNLYKVVYKGAGSLHAWTQALNGFAVNVSGFRGKTDARFKASDNKFNIGIPATARKVIAVGAYINRASYTDILERTQRGLNYNNQKEGALAFFSSIGPTLDGRTKPEFSAPGLNVASSLSRYAERDSTAMIDANTVVFSGTSMSCPFTAGAVALYLEKHPEATYEELTTAIDSTTIKDAAVNASGTLPNNVWGYGKLDIFRAMGGVLATSVAEQATGTLRTIVYPHPASDNITFVLPEGDQWKNIEICDVTGRVVYAVPVSLFPFSIETAAWGRGVYFYRIEGARETLRGQFILQ